MPILKKGEQIVREEPVKMIVNGVPQSGGTLILTNLRIVYEMKKGGFLGGGGIETKLDASLDGVSNVTSSKPLIPIPLITRKVIRIEWAGGAYEFGVKDAEGWRAIIIDVVQRYKDYKEEVTEKKIRLEAEREEQDQLEREQKETLEYDRKYKLEVDREKAAAERAAHVSKAGGTQIGHLGDVKTEIKDSVLQRSKIGGAPGEPEEDSPNFCPECGAKNTGSKFCPECGKKF